jgi:hypothetical protein
MKEKRKSIRVNLLNHPEVYDAHSNQILGNMVDINLGGFKIITNNQMDQGKEYLLSIVLPEGSSGGENVVVKADVRWCSKDINPKFASGCHFIQPDGETIISLMR